MFNFYWCGDWISLCKCSYFWGKIWLDTISNTFKFSIYNKDKSVHRYAVRGEKKEREREIEREEERERERERKRVWERERECDWEKEGMREREREYEREKKCVWER